MRILAPLLATLALGAAADPAAAAESCAERGSTTLDATRAARLYVTDGRLYACSYATGRRVRLARRGGTIGNAQVAGRHVAYTVGHDNQVGRMETVYVRDVRSRRWLARGLAPEVPEAGFARTDAAEVVSLALARNGRATWGVQYVYGEASRQRVQIVAFGRDGSKRLLAAGPLEAEDRIDAFSLALADVPGAARAYWMSGGLPQSAALSPG